MPPRPAAKEGSIKKGSNPPIPGPTNEVRLSPQPAEVQDAMPWARVVGRKEKGAQKQGKQNPPPATKGLAAKAAKPQGA